uniref:RecQ mediated genome instability 2 n=1 Tax=Saimiri boliviensis boliviensis TaxID=39432 RepID=A0A2K6UQU0_SAIBB
IKQIQVALLFSLAVRSPKCGPVSGTAVPRQLAWKSGKSVMVMGVVQACSPKPRLQAVKMTHLSDNPIGESMWELEVEDLHRIPQ